MALGLGQAAFAFSARAINFLSAYAILLHGKNISPNDAHPM